MSTYNIKTDFGAVGDGVTDDSGAFNAFNAMATGDVGLVTLNIPAGTYLFSNFSNFAVGIKQLLVIGAGSATTSLKSNIVGDPAYSLGGAGQFQNNTHSARLSTVSAGSTSVQLLTVGQTSLFTVGQYALITGYDLQGFWNAPFGYPTNPHFFEYVLVSNINAGTGVITFSAPLRNTYKSTWPNYNSGNASEVDNGGPATLYALPTSWDTEVEYRGIKFDNPDWTTRAKGRSVTYTNCSFNGQLGPIPSENKIWSAIGCDLSTCVMEVDKLIEEMTFSGTTIYEIDFQSSSTDLCTLESSTVTHIVQGTPKRFVANNSTIASLKVGCYAYGRSDSINCTDCTISAFDIQGLIRPILGSWVMSGGIITIPNSDSNGTNENQGRWAVPGTNVMWRGSQTSQTLFKIIDVTQDATNIYIQTNLSNGFPATAGLGSVLVHPAPAFTFTNCTGHHRVVDLSKAPPGRPLYSYWKRTYDGSASGPWSNFSGTADNFPIWGKLIRLDVNVTKAYTGVQNTLLIPNLSKFDNYVGIRTTDYSSYVFGSTISVKTVTDTSFPIISSAPISPIWMTGIASNDISLSANISGEASSVWPSIDIEIFTDQGIVSPLTVPLRLSLTN